MQTVEKSHLKAYLDGFYLKRIGTHVIAIDENKCEAAINALENGETVALVENGRIVSYVKDNGEAYVETDIL